MKKLGMGRDLRYFFEGGFLGDIEGDMGGDAVGGTCGLKGRS